MDISYFEIDISSDLILRGEMIKKANGTQTVSQIFVNNEHLGSFSEFCAMQQSGKLYKLLKD